MHKPTIDEERSHYLNGVDRCLVCGEEVFGQWTDYNGQIRCSTCGCTYQILGCKLREEYLIELGITKDQVAKRYCDVFSHTPFLKAYFEETGRMLPHGTYLGKSPVPRQDYVSFYAWILKHRRQLKDWKDDFNWVAVKDMIGKEQHAAT